MDITADNYKIALLSLLPTGLAWNKEHNSELDKLMLALSQSLGRCEESVNSLINEIIPSRAIDLLDDWADFAGVPECSIETLTQQEKQQQVKAKLNVVGTLSLKALEQLALDYGFVIEIKNIYPHNILRPITYPLYTQSCWFMAAVYYESSEGYLPCLLDRYKPAHINFVYISVNNRS